MKREAYLNALAFDLTALVSSRFRRAVVRCCVRFVLVLVLAGCSGSQPDPSATSAPAADRAVSVQVAQVIVTTLRPKLDLVGTIVPIPERMAVVSPQLGGWVRKMNVVQGQSITAGDVLVELDPRSAQAAVERGQGVVAEKEAAVERLKNGYLREEIAGARQDRDKAAAIVDGLTGELTALKKLLDRGETSPVTYQIKAKAMESATAALASAQERAKLLEAGTRPELIAEAQGVLAAAQADLEQAKLALDWCTIASPIDGVVVQLLARKGQYFDRAISLATIIDLDQLFVQLRIPSRDFGKVRVGTQMELRLNSLPGHTFPASVARLSGQADPLTGNVIVFARVENHDHLLLPSLSCNARISLPAVPNSLAIPVAAVADNSGTPVVTLIRDGKAYATEVRTGTETHDLVQILKGLSVGDQVATFGGYGLPDGCPVKIMETSVGKKKTTD